MMLIIAASLSIAAIAIIPIFYHQANAKECNGSSCSDKEGSDSNSNDGDHSNSDDNNHDGGDNSAKKDKTPFVLSTPVPFP